MISYSMKNEINPDNNCIILKLYSENRILQEGQQEGTDSRGGLPSAIQLFKLAFHVP